MSLLKRVSRPGGFSFPGWGRAASIAVVKTAGGELAAADEIAAGAIAPDAPPSHGPPHASLGQFTATSIAGNDLLSSCLYTAGACAKYAGKLAPFSLALVGFMLYFFRFVYSEVVTAMPVNGGSYNALLNTTSKRFAAMAACLSLISYVATAVVSGCYAMIYLKSVWVTLDVHAGTIVVLGAFALLTLIGVGESAVVATGMFFLHVFALLLLCAWCLAAAIKDNFSVLSANWDSPYPTITTTTGGYIADGSAPGALFFGYAAALLGITGFETAANYVEEMRDSSVYVSTLRNMWWAAALFNPVISLLVMGVVPMNSILDPTQSNKLLCVAAKAAADITHPHAPGVGRAFSGFIAVDATVVLAGSVLTAYVGVTGLVRRLALDRCLPELLMAVNKLRGTAHWTILGFFALTATLFLVLYPPSAIDTSGVDQLGNVYDLAFLSVMSMFAVSAFILKWKRPDLPRRVITRTGTVATALVCVLAGLAGNIVEGPGTLPYFILYVGAIAAVVFAMFQRASILKFIYKVARGLLASEGERTVAKARENALVAAHRKTEETRLAVAHAAAVRASVRLTPAASPTGGDGSINGSSASAASPLLRNGASSAGASDAALALLTPSPSSSSATAADGAAPAAAAEAPVSVSAPAASHLLDDGVVGLPATPTALLAAVSSTPRVHDSVGGGAAAPAAGKGPHGAYAALPASEEAADGAAAAAGGRGGSGAARFFGFGSAASASSSAASSSSSAVPNKRISSVGVALGPVAAAPSAPPAALSSSVSGSGVRGRLATEDAGDADGDPDGLADDDHDDGDDDGEDFGEDGPLSAGAGAGAGADYVPSYSPSATAPSSPTLGGEGGSAALPTSGAAAWASTGAGATAPAPAGQGVGLRRRRLRNSSSYFARAGAGASVTAGVALAVASQAGVPAGSFRNALGDVRLAPGAAGGNGSSGSSSSLAGAGAGSHGRGAGSSLNAPLLGSDSGSGSTPAVRPAAALAARGGSAWKRRVSGWLASQIRSINGQQVVYFAKRPDLVSLNKAVQYVRDNELTSRLVVVHVVDDREAVRRLIVEAAEALASGGDSTDETAAGPAGQAAGAGTAGAPANGGLKGGIQLADMSLSRGSSFAKRGGGGDGDAASVDGSSSAASVGAGAGAGPGVGGASTLAFRTDVSAGAAGSTSMLSLLDRLPPPSSEVVQLQHNCALLDAVYPKLRIDCLVIRGSFFSPPVVSFLSRYLRVTPNLMFMAMPDARFPHQFAALGGVRVITRTAQKGERAAAARHLQRVLAEIRAHQHQASSRTLINTTAASGDAAAALV